MAKSLEHVIFLALILVASTVSAAIPGQPAAMADEGPSGTVSGTVVLDQISPKNDAINAVIPEKFDDGFLAKLENLTTVQDGVGGLSEPYYPVLIVVPRSVVATAESDPISSSNKEDVVEKLRSYGAVNITKAEALSFVTAFVPVSKVSLLSQHDSVLKVGDGNQEVYPLMSNAIDIVSASASSLTSVGSSLSYDGTGVTIAVIDSGINSVFLNDKITKRVKCANSVSCDNYTIYDDPINEPHGTYVASIIALNESSDVGIAPGVSLLDVRLAPPFSISDVGHALTWALQNNADIVNLSFGLPKCNPEASYILLIDEAVDRGMFVSISAGNYGYNEAFGTAKYSDINAYGCSNNALVIGGINDNNSIEMDQFSMYILSSKGPALYDGSNPKLRPNIVAPADIKIRCDDSFPNDCTYSGSAKYKVIDGTSYASPMASAASAIILQAKPDYAPHEVKAALLASSTWTGPSSCNANMYEANNSTNPCSYSHQPANLAIANGNSGLKILNNVGLGILNVSRSLSYVLADPPHVVGGNVTTLVHSTYVFEHTDASVPVKVVLTWPAHPLGSILDQINKSGQSPISNLEFTIKDSSGTKVAESSSDHQNVEFAVFSAPVGNYTVTVSRVFASGTGMQQFALASSNGLVSNSPPSGVPQSVLAVLDSVLDFFISATDPDGDALSYTISAQPQMGTLSAPDSFGNVTYTPNNGASGIDNFTFVASDGFGSSEPVTVTINITAPAAVPPPAPVTVFSDDFEGGLSQWANSGDEDWVSSTPDTERGDPASGKVARAADCDDECVMATASIDLSGYDSANLTFWRFLDRNADPGEFLLAEAYDGSSWVELAKFVAAYGNGIDDDGKWHKEAYSLDAYAGSSTKIRFTADVSKSNERAEVDDVEVVAAKVGPAAPTKPGTDNPAPAPALVSPLEEGFEGGLSAWTAAGYGTWSASEPTVAVPGSASGNKVLYTVDCYFCSFELTEPVDISGLPSPKLQLKRFLSQGVDSNEYLKLYLSSDGGSSWTEVAEWTGALSDYDSWRDFEYDLDSFKSSEFSVRLNTRTSYYNEIIMVDDLRVTFKGSDAAKPAPAPAPKPEEPAASTDYAIYVSSESHEVHRYMPDGTFVDKFVAKRSGGLDEPWGLAFGPDGHLYVADNDENAILRYDSSGNPAGSGSSPSTDATWADTLSRPYGIEWDGDTLYVAEYSGMERFTKSGESLGYFGQAKNPSGSPYVSNLFLAYDVAVGTDGKFYAAPSYPQQIFVYDKSTGNYADKVSDSSQPYNGRGLAWDTAGTASTGDDTLLIAGPNKVAVVDPSTKAVTATHSHGSYIDRPYGTAVGPDGVIYVANEDDNNVGKINGTVISSLFPSRNQGMDDPVGVAIGPAPPAGAAGAVGGAAGAVGGAAGAAALVNEEPDFDVIGEGGWPVSYVELRQGSTASLPIEASDPEGDPVSLRLDGAPGFVSILDEGGPVLHVDASAVAAGHFGFDIIATDGQAEEDRAYLVVVDPLEPEEAGGASGAGGAAVGAPEPAEPEVLEPTGAPAPELKAAAGSEASYIVLAEGADYVFLHGAPGFAWIEEAGAEYVLRVDASGAEPGSYEFYVVAVAGSEEEGVPYALTVTAEE